MSLSFYMFIQVIRLGLVFIDTWMSYETIYFLSKGILSIKNKFKERAVPIDEENCYDLVDIIYETYVPRQWVLNTSRVLVIIFWPSFYILRYTIGLGVDRRRNPRVCKFFLEWQQLIKLLYEDVRGEFIHRERCYNSVLV